MLATIRRTVERYDLRRDLRCVVVAVSGGADSVALLWALHQLWRPMGIEVIAAHVDHGIRVEEGPADARFVEGLARRIGIPCIVVGADVPAEARATGESLEMAARRVRYAALREIVLREKADALCTGHTCDDQLETLFLRLARGTGPQGLGGISARTVRRDGLVVLRPLLACRRAAIRTWLVQQGVDWREDATNADTTIPRNLVRQRLVPVFETCLGASAVAAVARSLDLFREEERDWLGPMVQEALGRVRREADAGSLDCVGLRGLGRPLARRVLLAWLHGHDAPADRQSFARLERLLDFAISPCRGTREMPMGEGCRVSRVYEVLRFAHTEPVSEAALPEVPVTPLGTTDAGAWGLELESVLTHGIERPPRRDPLDPPHVATLRWDAVEGHRLTLRPIRAGDRMAPLGAPGRSALSDMLINLKVPRSDRSRVPVIACDGEPVWLPGVAISATFAVPSESSLALRLVLRRKP